MISSIIILLPACLLLLLHQPPQAPAPSTRWSSGPDYPPPSFRRQDFIPLCLDRTPRIIWRQETASPSSRRLLRRIQCLVGRWMVALLFCLRLRRCKRRATFFANGRGMDRCCSWTADLQLTNLVSCKKVGMCVLFGSFSSGLDLRKSWSCMSESAVKHQQRSGFYIKSSCLLNSWLNTIRYVGAIGLVIHVCKLLPIIATEFCCFGKCTMKCS